MHLDNTHDTAHDTLLQSMSCITLHLKSFSIHEVVVDVINERFNGLVERDICVENNTMLHSVAFAK